MARRTRARRKRKKKKGKRGRASPGTSAFPRLRWSRSPAEKPHSTRKGARGYDRKRAKETTRRDAEEESASSGS
jgi:hypothetical protein